MSPTGSRFSSESAPGRSIMGSEDKVEQSLGRPSRQATAGPSGHANSPSLIGRLGSSTFRLSATAMSMSPTGSRFSSESAPGRSIMGSEDEVEQSLGRASRQAPAGSSGHEWLVQPETGYSVKEFFIR